MLVRALGTLAVLVALYFGLRAAVDAVGLVPLLLLVGLVLAVELGAAVSALLDWREAKLEIGDRGASWFIGHATLVRRLGRRARWHASTLRLCVPAGVQAVRLGRHELAARATPAPTTVLDDERAA